MVSQMDGPFINISRLNFPKYASDKQLSKLLFNYIYYQQNDIRNVNVLTYVFIYNNLFICILNIILFRH